MRKVTGMLFILAVGIYLTVYITFLSIPAVEVFNDIMPEAPVFKYNEAEESLYGFITSKLIAEDGGILTNTRDYAGSKDTLAESVGLMMNYCLLANSRKQFNSQFEFLQKKMLKDGSFIKWRTGESPAGCNAAIDDLRIIRALLDGYDMWGSREYYNLAGNLQHNMFKHQVKGRALHELYDWESNRSRPIVPLCYLDLYTIDRMSEFNAKWLTIEENSLSIIADGRIGKSPFYYKYYDYDTGCYSYDEEYKKQNGICLTYTIYTAIHLAEVNEDTDFFTQWLKNEMMGGRLYAWYNPESLSPVNKIESTAVYALAAIYADKAGEKQLCDRLVKEMKKFMITDTKSPYYGGFGSLNNNYFHSFDNLTALWALNISGRN